MGKTLYIIGNGFDLSLNIKSSYGDFYKYLKLYEQPFLNKLTDIYPQFDTESALRRYKDINYLDIDLWSDFESELSNYVVPDNIRDLLIDNLKSLDSFYLNELDLVTATETSLISDYTKRYNILIETLRTVFNEWVKQIDISHVNKDYRFNRNSNFISFNYTTTLEDICGIASERICHIHGEKGDPKLVIGHCWDLEKSKSIEIEETRYYQNLYDNQYKKEADKEVFIRDETQFQKDQLNMAIRDCFREKIIKPLEKDTASIMENNDQFFTLVENVSKIVTIGHSLSKVDMPYFHAIKDNVPRNTSWHVSYHSEEDCKRAEKFKRELGISNNKFKKFYSEDQFDLTKINYL